MITLFPSLLLAGLGLALAPVVLHLLNLQRQQPVRWAAMEFLLESQARNRAWINLKQWLLLAARVAAILLAGLMAARPQLTGGFARWLPQEPVHHIVLLDDSYSMNDRGGERTPWENATAAIDALALRAAESNKHRVTVIRSSSPGDPLSFADKQLLTLRELATSWQPSQSAGGLAEAITTAGDEAGRTPSGERVAAYVLSDFRRSDLLDTDEVSARLDRLADRSGSLALAPCAKNRHGNLTISDLSLLPSATVAGIEMTASLAVTNNGPTDTDRTAVRLWRNDTPLPAVELEGLPAGDSLTQRFPVRFRDPGDHRLRAELPGDAIAEDNVRRLACNLPATRSVLIVDGTEGHEGQAISTALQPRGSVVTGWSPETCEPNALPSVGDLSRFAAVLLLDVERLNAKATAAVHRYVESGGGLILVLGENVSRRFYNRQLLAGAAKPLLPVRLDLPTQTAVDATGRPSTLRVVDHPALRVFAGDRASFLDLIRVRQRHTLRAASDSESDVDGVKVLASLSSGAPLLLETIGSTGRVICLLTSAARPERRLEGWSNLSISPLFPILINELAAYVAEPRLQPTQRLVGATWQSVVASAAPGATRLERHEDSGFVSLNSGENADEWGAAKQAGVYRLEGPSGAATTLAINVDPAEGALELVDEQELQSMFAAIDLTVTPADQLAGKQSVGGVQLYQRVGLFLLVLLAAEQAIAYWCSYHRDTSPRGVAA